MWVKGQGLSQEGGIAAARGLRKTCRGLLLSEIDEVAAAAQEGEAQAVGASVRLPPARFVTLIIFSVTRRAVNEKMESK